MGLFARFVWFGWLAEGFYLASGERRGNWEMGMGVLIRVVSSELALYVCRSVVTKHPE